MSHQHGYEYFEKREGTGSHSKKEKGEFATNLRSIKTGSKQKTPSEASKARKKISKKIKEPFGYTANPKRYAEDRASLEQNFKNRGK